MGATATWGWGGQIDGERGIQCVRSAQGECKAPQIAPKAISSLEEQGASFILDSRSASRHLQTEMRSGLPSTCQSLCHWGQSFRGVFHRCWWRSSTVKPVDVRVGIHCHPQKSGLLQKMPTQWCHSPSAAPSKRKQCQSLSIPGWKHHCHCHLSILSWEVQTKGRP